MVNELTTNEQGTCTIEGVEEGSLTLTITKEGYVEKTETINVTEDTSIDITLVEEEIEEPEEVESRDVDFSVTDSDNQAISGARITLTNTATNETKQNGNGGTGSSGGSKVNLDYGTYDVTVTKTDYSDTTFSLTVDETLSVDGENASIENNSVVVILNE